MTDTRLTACAALYHAVLDTLYPDRVGPASALELRMSREYRHAMGRGFGLGALEREISRLANRRNSDPELMIPYVEAEREWLESWFPSYMRTFDDAVLKKTA